MDDQGSTRRTFLGSSAAVAAGLASLSNEEASAAMMQTPRVRRNLGTLDMSIPADKKVLDQYTQGVQILIARSAANRSDQRGWGVQAGLHTYRCQHGNWWFLPWHRSYLYYFERMIQDAIGDSTFALPYWDWTSNSQLALPAAFRTVGSPLYDPRRIASVNSGALQLNWGWYNYYYGSVLNFILGRPAYLSSFGSSAAGSFAGLERAHGTEYPHGDFEGGPHDSLHGWMAGGGRPDMGNPVYAALDPIFWLHHGNIDRLWSRWRAASPATHTNPPNTTWRNQQFEFVRPDGVLELIRVSSVINSWNAPLGYRYDDETTPPPSAAPAMAAATAVYMNQGATGMETPPPESVATVGETAFEVADAPLTFSLKLRPTAKQAVNQAMMAPAMERPSRVFLLIEGIEFEAKASGVVEVYLNAPPMEKGKRPDKEHAVGTFSFFVGHPPMPKMAMPRHGGGQGPPMPETNTFSRIFDITENVRALDAAGKWDPDKAKVTLVRESFEPDAPPVGVVTFKRAEIRVVTQN